jgi:hypothetical protein
MDRQVADAQAAYEALPEAHRHSYGELYRSYRALLEKSASGGISAEQCAAVIDHALSAPSRGRGTGPGVMPGRLRCSPGC